MGRQSRLLSGGATTEEDGIFINSASSKLLERAHDILMSVTLHAVTENTESVALKPVCGRSPVETEGEGVKGGSLQPLSCLASMLFG